MVETRSGRAQCAVEVAAAVDLNLQSVDVARRSRVPLDHVASREGIVQARMEAKFSGDLQCLVAYPGVSGAPATIPDDDGRNALRWRRHGVAVEKQRAAEAIEEK